MEENKAINKRTTKNRNKLLANGILIYQLSQPLGAVIVPLPIPIERLSPLEQAIMLENSNSHPKIAPILKSKLDKMVLTDEQIDDLNLICYQLQKGSITIEKAILEIRGGDFYDWANVAFIIYMFYLQETNAFPSSSPLPSMNPFDFFSRKYKYDPRQNPNQSLAYPPSRFERDTLHTLKQMCKTSADENSFIMSYDEAYNLIKETYNGSMQVTENLKITD